jgi:hypothetical protein
MEIKWAAGNGNEPESLSQKRPSSMAHLGRLLQGVRRSQRAQGAGWILADSTNVIKTTGRTRRNFARAIKFDVGRQVVWKIDFVAVGQLMFQCELIGGGINLAKIIDATISFPSRATSSIGAVIWYRNRNNNSNDEDQ